MLERGWHADGRPERAFTLGADDVPLRVR